MSDPVARLSAALEGRYAIEREMGEGGMATVRPAKRFHRCTYREVGCADCASSPRSATS